MIKASRDDCTSPCPVFFDAIADLSWDDIEASKFTWAFGDGTTASGFMAAHVFELPEGEPETKFVVTLSVERDGFLGRDAHTVAVRQPKGRTICVAQSDFSGCPSSRPRDHFNDVRAAWNAIETNGRILFRRGDSFSPGIRFGSNVAGPVHVGAFGHSDQPRPALVQSGGSWKIGSEWSLTDLDISGAGMGDTLIAMPGVNALLLRCHIHDAFASFTSTGKGYDFSTHKFLIDNVMTEMDGTNYIGGNYIAIVGNHIERRDPKHHTIRVAGGKHVLISDNALISDVGHNALTVRGSQSANRAGSDYVLVQGNLIMQKATVHPQNEHSNESLRHVIWERNLHVPHESQSSLQTGLAVNGIDMVIRNNIFYQIRRAITLEKHPLAGPSRNIHIYQNTQFVDQDKDSKNYFCEADPESTGTTIENNLALLYGHAESSTFASVEANAVIDRNYTYSPSRTKLCKRPDGSAMCTDPQLMNTSDPSKPTFMRPEAGSLAIDAAIDALVSVDFYSTPRPQGAAPDIGAVERPR